MKQNSFDSKYQYNTIKLKQVHNIIMSAKRHKRVAHFQYFI